MVSSPEIQDDLGDPPLVVTKHRSSGKTRKSSDTSQSVTPMEALAIDTAGEDKASDSLRRSPLLSPMIETGLNRIRQQPVSGARILSTPSPRLGPSPQISPQVSRKSSLAASPLSPSLPSSEELERFPSESLHSFSFAHPGNDHFQHRQNVVKRSVDFLRDKSGWAVNSPRIASAQAKLSGDDELLSMLELLQKAKMMHSGGFGGNNVGLGIGHGPLTGPVHHSNDNPFEKSFAGSEHVPTPTSLSRMASADTPTITEEPEEDEQAIRDPRASVMETANATGQRGLSDMSKTDTDDTFASVQRPQRASLKRTYTDVGDYSLQHKLNEALAQPYRAEQDFPSAESSTDAPSFKPSQPARSSTLANDRVSHGRRNDQAQIQAFFTTEDHAPWTITAANDLACLVFGVTRAEVRKLGIMEVIAESHRAWLTDRLRKAELGRSTASSAETVPESRAASIEVKNSQSTLSSALGGGITAKLLSKPPSRQTLARRRTKTDPKAITLSSNPPIIRDRGVLLCGEVVPIHKMNGSTGSASLWVKEKGGGLIWIVEEIAEDVAYLTIDEIGSVLRGKGDVHAIWGLERVRNGMDVQRLLPTFPKLTGTHTGAMDYEAVARLKYFTARTSNAISIPVTVEQLHGESTFRISSFPHIAGMMVLNSTTMRVSSSNTVFSAALFGQANPSGLPMTDLIPDFEDVLRVMTDEDELLLEDGIVIPEHNFRRARALLALREGKQDAAQVFLRPSGLPAKHRDGSDIMVDVQMRVVRSASGPWNPSLMPERSSLAEGSGSAVFYALWITYSRHLHAANHGIGPVTPMMSRPTTPPQQPSPSTRDIDSAMPSPYSGGSNTEEEELRTTLLTQQLERAKTSQGDAPSNTEPYEHPSPAMIAEGVNLIQKKRIDDFTIVEDMGAGAYGQVKLARYKKAAAKKMVIKYVTKRRILVDTWHRDRRLGTVPLEIHVLDYLRRDGLQHPNIIDMADFFEDDTNYYIEMLPHGQPGMDLFDFIELNVDMEEWECRLIFKQVANALAHLHLKAKVVHRDVKDENVVLDSDGKVKLVDFGSAAYIKSGPFNVFVGTVDYAAPEVLRKGAYGGKEQDVWALGILLYTIVYKENPFWSIDEILDHDLRVPFIMSDDSIDLIRKLLDRDVEQRIDIEGVLAHPWYLAEDVIPEGRKRIF